MNSRGKRGNQPRSSQNYRASHNTREEKRLNKFRGSSQFQRHRNFNDRAHWKRTHFRRHDMNYREKDSYRSRSYIYDEELSNVYSSFDNTQPNTIQEEISPPLPGSEADRINKIELEKKRIREALSSGADANQPMVFNEDVIDNRTEDKIRVIKKFNTELRLTTSDLMEIGSVTGKISENSELPNEPTDDNFGTVSASQNVPISNDRTFQKSNKTASNKSNLTGWKSFQIPNDSLDENVSNSQNQKSSGVSNQNYKQIEERILGNIEDRQNNAVTSKSLSIRDTGRIGRLYKSFLKRRYFDKKNKSNEEEPQRQKIQNPFLDRPTSTAASEPSKSSDKEKHPDEPPMPQPLQVKLETMEANERHVESMEELEADEFLKDFSHLLTPDYKIPPEILEQLGLQHLLEDNIVPTNNTNTPLRENHSSQNKPESLLRVKSLTVLNSTPFTDNIFTQRDKTPTRNDTSSPMSTHSAMRLTPPLLLNQSFNVPTENNSLNQSVDKLAHLGFNVEQVMNEVVDKLVTTSKNDSVRDLNQSNENFTYRHNNTGSRQTGCCDAQNQLTNISDKLLRMFRIDKQIQELMEEKKLLYHELMASREVASTFFNSWANENLTRLPNGPNNHSSYHQFNTDQNSERTNVRGNENTEDNVPENSVGRNDFSTLLNNVEEVKQYLMNFQSNTITEAVSACKQTLIDIKKESITNEGKTQSSDEMSLSNQSTSGRPTFQKNKKSKKRKNKSNNIGVKKRCVNEQSVSVQDVQQPECYVENNHGTNAIIDDDVIVINSEDENEQFEDLYETKFEPSKLKLNVKEPSKVESNNIQSKNDKDKTNLNFNHPDVTVVCMKIAEAHNLCVTGCRDGQILLYSTVNGRLKGKLKGHQETITCLVEYKGLIISGSTDSTLRCFHIKTKTALYSVNVGYAVQCMDLRYGYLFVGTKVGYLFKYTVKDELHLTDDPLSLTDSSILALKAAKEGVRNILIVAARGQQITVRDATTGLLLRTFSWCDTVYCLEFAGESPIVYCGTRSKSVVAVDFIDGEEKFKCDAGRGVTQICFAHNLMFTACYDGKIYVYDYKKMCLVTHIHISKGMLLSLLVHKLKIFVSTTRNEFLSIPFPQELKNHFYLQSKERV